MSIEMDSLGFIIFETDIDQSDNGCNPRFYLIMLLRLAIDPMLTYF